MDSLLFVEYQFSWVSWVQVNQEFKCSTNNIFSIDPCTCIQRFAKPRNQMSTNMQVFSNPRKLIPTKINESTVNKHVCKNNNSTFAASLMCIDIFVLFIDEEADPVIFALNANLFVLVKIINCK